MPRVSTVWAYADGQTQSLAFGERALAGEADGFGEFVPPATISLPIKLLMFVIIDGWALVIEGVVGGFQ
jgi:hypothetical protein